RSTTARRFLSPPRNHSPWPPWSPRRQQLRPLQLLLLLLLLFLLLLPQRSPPTGKSSCRALQPSFLRAIATSWFPLRPLRRPRPLRFPSSPVPLPRQPALQPRQRASPW